MTKIQEKNKIDYTSLVKDYIGFLETFEDFLISQGGKEFLTELNVLQRNQFKIIIDTTEMAIKHIELELPNEYLIQRSVSSIEELIQKMYLKDASNIYDSLMVRLKKMR